MLYFFGILIGNPKRFMHKKYLIATTCFLALLSQTVPWAVRAAEADTTNTLATIAVRAGEHTTYDRIVFDWPRQTPYELKKDGNKVRVVFSDVAKPAFDATAVSHLSRARGFSSAVEGGHLVVTFTVDTTATVSAFNSGNSVAIDVTSVAAKTESAPVPTAAPPVEPKPAEPKATETKAPDSKPSEKETAETKPAEPPVPPPTAKKSEEEAPAPKAEAREKVVAKTLPVTTNKIAASMPDVGDTPLLVLTLDPRVPSRSVIFSRAGYVYIVFDRSITVPLAELTAGTASRVTLEPIDLIKTSGYRFAIPSNVEVHATHTDTAWQIYLNRQMQGVPVNTTLVAQPNFALGARYCYRYRM